jgi:thioredoxin-related protein
MKKLILIILLVAIGATSFSQSTSGHEAEKLLWHTNMMQAYELSKSTKKPIFAFFTGSDWCGWCRKLQKDVFQKTEFIEWAKDNVILVELDFPRTKKLPDDLAQQNQELQQVFRVSGFPTIWVFFLNKDESSNKFSISALGSLGYPRGAVSGREEIKFLKDANDVLANNKTK